MKTDCNKIAVRSSVKPQPSKNEIAEAMLRRSKQLWDAEQSQLREKRTNAHDAVIKCAEKLFKKNPCMIKANFNISWQGKVHFSCDIEDPRLISLGEAYKAAENNPCEKFDEKAERNRIREIVFGGRVTAMLKEPETIKALDSLLNASKSIDIEST